MPEPNAELVPVLVVGPGQRLVLDQVAISGRASSAIAAIDSAGVVIRGSRIGVDEGSDFTVDALDLANAGEVQVIDSQIGWFAGSELTRGSIAAMGATQLHMRNSTVGAASASAVAGPSTIDAISYSGSASGSLEDVTVVDAGSGSGLELHDAGAVAVSNLTVQSAGRSAIVVFGRGQLTVDNLRSQDVTRGCAGGGDGCADVIVYDNHVGDISVGSPTPVEFRSATADHVFSKPQVGRIVQCQADADGVDVSPCRVLAE